MSLSERSYMAYRAAPVVGVEINKVVRNTYLLLSMTLLFSGAMAGVSMALGLPYFGLLITLGGYFGLLFLVNLTCNSAWGLLWVFALTGFMGLTLGPILNAYTQFYSNGTQLVMLAMGGTGAIFLGLSGYVLVTRKDFSFMGGMVMVGILVAFLAGICAAIFSIPTLALAVSAMFVLLMSGFILYETSALIHGGQRNYILATIGLFVAIFNLFTSLLHLLGAVSGRD